MMMNMTQGIHGVTGVRAVRLMPKNGNAVSIMIETEGGQMETTLYFGDGEKQAGDAYKLFYALDGDPADVVGSKAEQERQRTRGY